MMFATYYFEWINASLLLGEEFNGYDTVEEIDLSKIEVDIDKKQILAIKGSCLQQVWLYTKKQSYCATTENAREIFIK